VAGPPAIIRHSELFLILISSPGFPAMPHFNDDLDDREFPDEDDEDNDESETRQCPRCGADVYEDAEQCPLCGTWLTPDTSAWSGRAWWWVALGVLGTVAVVWMLSAGR
jgi:hypothetical protein